MTSENLRGVDDTLSDGVLEGDTVIEDVLEREIVTDPVTDGDTDGDELVDGDTLGVPEAVPVIELELVGDGDTDRVTDGVVETDGVTDGVAETEGLVVTDDVTDGSADGEAVVEAVVEGTAPEAAVAGEGVLEGDRVRAASPAMAEGRATATQRAIITAVVSDMVARRSRAMECSIDGTSLILNNIDFQLISAEMRSF